MITSTKPRKFCFVLMPFTEDFDDIYQLGIKQSCEDAGAYCERVDEQLFTESILERIYNQISKADFVIADMTNRNPNVFYEVGYAHALGKQTILLTQNADDIPFDLKHYPHIIYNNKISTLKKDILPRIKWFVENVGNELVTQNVDIEVYLGDKSLNNKNVRYVTKASKIPSPELTLHNNSFKTFSPGDYRIGVITDQNYTRIRKREYGNEEGIKTTKLPDGRNLHMCKIIEDILYPNSYTSLQIMLEPYKIRRSSSQDVEEFYNDEQEITIRVFTPNGTRDFFLIVDYEKENLPDKPS